MNICLNDFSVGAERGDSNANLPVKERMFPVSRGI
jgi:hypothetical protein